MARISRIALDFALVSIKTIRPAVTNLWRGSKKYILESSAKRIVDNNLVERAESALHDVSENIESKLTTLRNNQIPKEIEYLKKELQKARKKLKDDNKEVGKRAAETEVMSTTPMDILNIGGPDALLAFNKKTLLLFEGPYGFSFWRIPLANVQTHELLTAKAVKPAIGTAWQYAKIEMVPPFTGPFFAGRGGRKIEQLADKTASNLIGGLETMIRDIEAEELRQIKLKEDAAKAAVEKIKKEARIARDKAKKAVKAKQLEKTKANQNKYKTEVPSKPKGSKKGKAKSPGRKTSKRRPKM